MVLEEKKKLAGIDEQIEAVKKALQKKQRILSKVNLEICQK